MGLLLIVVLLQQYLPFTVLKQKQMAELFNNAKPKLQQYLPFTVLKLKIKEEFCLIHPLLCCNSTYRLRYWNNK